MILSVDEVEGHPGWSVEYTRTQGMDDDTWWVWDEPNGRLGGGFLIGIGDSRDAAIQNAEEEESP